jgi:sulfur-carrier protein
MIRVILPHHLQTLARCDREVAVNVEGSITQRAVLDSLEAHYPMLRGTVREHVTMKRRPRVRFFADGEDVTHNSPDAELPRSIASGEQPFMIVGAVAGG